MESNNVPHIESVQWLGLWNRYNINWQLNPDINILIGPNGMGKSTLLKGIYYSFISCIKDLGKTPEQILFKDFSYFSLSLTLKNSADKKVIIYEEKPPNKFAKYLGIDFNKLPQTPKLSTKDFKSNFNIIPDFIDTFDSYIHSKTDYQKRNKPNLNSYLDEKLDDLINQYIEYQLNQTKKVRNNGKAFNEVFRQRDYFVQTVNKLMQHTFKEIDEESNRIVFRTIDSSETIIAHQLSAGEKQLLIILLTVLVQDEKPSILLLDEPEISLHLEWQEQLIGILRKLNPNCQLIIVTHSPGIMMDGWLDKVTEIKDIIQPFKLATTP